MSYSAKKDKINSAYSYPFTGSGIAFDPIGVQADRSGIVLHETGYKCASCDWNFPSVLSSFWRVYYDLDRGHSVQFDESVYELGPDHIVLIPDHQLFHCHGPVPTRSFWMHFSFDHNPAADQRLPILLKPDLAERSLIESMSALIQTATPATLRIQRLSMALIHVLLSRPEISWRPALPDQLNKIIRYIEAHADRKIPNNELARQAGISVEGVYRLFRTHLDTSPAHYVNQIRIRNASHLLAQHDYSIDEVAEFTGFPNRAYFSRIFKQITDMTPAAFRDRSRN